MATKKKAKKKAKKTKRPAKGRGQWTALAQLGRTDVTMARAKGRLGSVLQVRLPATLHKAFIEEARNAGVPASAVLREAALAWLKARGKRVDAPHMDARHMPLFGGGE
jgi:hypothetical protein